MLVLEDEIQRLRPSILIRFNNQRPSYLKKDVTLQTELIRLRAPLRAQQPYKSEKSSRHDKTECQHQ